MVRKICPACGVIDQLNVKENLCSICGYDYGCDHEWEPEDDSKPYWWDSEAIGVNVMCTKCNQKGVELWIYSNTNAVRTTHDNTRMDKAKAENKRTSLKF